MHQLPVEQQILLVAQIVALLALSARLSWEGLYKVYFYFLCYLVVELLQLLVPVFVSLDARMYRDLYVATQALVICFSTLVVLELYSVVFRGLPGIGNVSRRYIKLILVLAVLLSLLPLGLETTPSTVTGYLFVFQRPIMTSLLIFILSLTGFLVYYPVPLGRNVLAYLIGYAVYFIANATTIFIRNLGHYWSRPLSDVQMLVYFSCLVFWAFALNRSGETKRMVLGHQWKQSDEGRLLAQLEAINTSLLRSGGPKQKPNRTLDRDKRQ
jgi:hypothetical protein